MANWQSTGTTLELNTNQLPGGEGALRVVASDGFLSGQDTTGVFGVPIHAPSVQILLPNPDQVFFPTQQVVLQGSAYDLEDGVPDDSAFVWSSNIDGVLGSGALMSTAELSTGVHAITLTVTDSNGMSSMDMRTIEIAEEGSIEANNLESSPAGIYVTTGFGDPAIPYIVTLRSSGETELDWDLSEDIPWLSVGQNTGTTPSELTLTFDPSGLPVGIYSEVIQINSDQASNNPLELLVTLQVTGEALYLPVIFR